jgi:hypothetical protein
MLTFFAKTRTPRRQRRRALRDAIHASYNEAGADPEFQAETQQVNEDFDAGLGNAHSNLVPAP